MLPFAKMIKYGNILPPSTTILDIDFSTQNVGDTFIRDNAGTQFSLIGTAGMVQYDSTLGKNVFKFSGAGYYKSPQIYSGTRLDLTNKSFEVVLQFKATTTSQIQDIWETGNYSYRRIYGICNSINQYPSTYFQWFMDNGRYNRVLMNGVNPLAWDTVTITYIKNSDITVKSQYYNSTQTFPAYGFGMGTNLSIGGSYVNAEVGGAPFYFTGSLAKLKITEIK